MTGHFLKKLVRIRDSKNARECYKKEQSSQDGRPDHNWAQADGQGYW